MKITVTVKTRAREESVEKLADGNYLVSVKTAPVDNKANKALLKLLARHFHLAQSSIEITHGLSSKHKIIELPMIIIDQ